MWWLWIFMKYDCDSFSNFDISIYRKFGSGNIEILNREMCCVAVQWINEHHSLFLFPSIQKSYNIFQFQDHVVSFHFMADFLMLQFIEKKENVAQNCVSFLLVPFRLFIQEDKWILSMHSGRTLNLHWDRWVAPWGVTLYYSGLQHDIDYTKASRKKTKAFTKKATQDGTPE